MKLIDLRCSSCGAMMQVNPDLKKVVCNYCGSELLIDDESKKIEIANSYEYGYEAEKGKIKAQEEKLLEQKEKNKRKSLSKLIIWSFLFVLSLIAIKVAGTVDTFFVNIFSLCAFVLFVCIILALKDFLVIRG
ncbi:MAG: hypothetical protein IJ747_02495 [Lachnospiraceae bacterium]|nr:hypothetical protein [Lachnospiraceae bacterium]